MSSQDSYLAHSSGGYTAPVDLKAVRQLLRAERKNREWSLDDLAAKAGVNRSSIHDIEVNNGGKPRFETIAKLIEDGLGLTLSSFFSQIERQTNPGLSNASESATTASTAKRSRGDGGRTTHDDESRPAVSSSDARGIVRDALLDMSNGLLDAIKRLNQADEQAPVSRAQQPRRTASHRSRR